jgi:hypothetical protein
MLQFRAAAHDRVATEARDLDQELGSTPAPLEGQQTDEPPPVFLIQGGQHAIDGAMVFRLSAIGMLPTDLTGADMNRLSRLPCHRRSLLGADRDILKLDSHRQERAYYKNIKLF